MTAQPILRSTTPRTTEPICPPWCAGHDDYYQPWERAGDGRYRNHDSANRLVHGVSIDCCQVQNDDTMAPALVEVSADTGSGFPAALTPTQAMNVAKAILDAAEKVAIHSGAAR